VPGVRAKPAARPADEREEAFEWWTETPEYLRLYDR